MIGPHEGKELELMLAGKKHLAIFYDRVKPDHKIAEDIIPEQSFAPHVQTGTIMRFSQDFMHKDHTVHYVCFTSPAETWRAKAFFWLHAEGISGSRPFDDAYENFVGRLLGYEESDIVHFITHNSTYRRTVS